MPAFSSPPRFTPHAHPNRIRHLVIFACAALAFNLLPAQTPAPAPAPSALDTLFKKGADAYNRGDYDTSIASFEQIIKLAKPGPVLEPIYYSIASAKLRKGDNDGAIAAFHLYLRTYPNGSQINDARASLTKALIAAKRMPEALAAIASLRELRSRTGSQGIDNYAAVLGLTLDIADSLMEAKKPAEALELLQTALWRDQIIDRQRRRIVELDRLFKQASASASISAGAESALGANRDALASRLKDAKDAMKSVEDNATFDIPRLLRQGQCYMELSQPWEAIVVYDEILSRFPSSPDRVYALRGLVYAKQNANLLPEAQALCQRFIDEFPSSPFAPEVAAVGGQIAAQLQDNTKAAEFFGSAVQNTQGPMLERVIFQLGGTRFALGDWPGARQMFDRYIKDYPKGEWADNAGYRSAISWFLDGNDADRYTKAEKAIKAFVANNPSSVYLADGYYRLAVCQFAFQEYPQAIAACDDWEKRFPTDGLLAEVLSLKGDVQKTIASNATEPKKAAEYNRASVETYLRAASAASSDEVLGYALGEAGKLLEQEKDWTRLSSVFSSQIERQPDSKLVMGWYYWVAKAKAKAGHASDAWDFLADSVGKQLDNPANEDVEKILELMAQIRAKERPVAGAPAPSALEQLTERLKLANDAPALVRARLQYYQARVLTLSRKPDEAEKIILALGREMPADQMSAALLAVAGESLLKAGDSERAKPFFNALLERFPSSDYRDYAYVGLGNMALDRKDADAALKAYTDALKKAGAVHRQREATVGQARSLLALGQLDKAAKLFELVAGAKEWRGEATALSLYYMGEIAIKQGDLPKGIAFFQRIFLSYVRYPEWVAKSYIASGKAFEDLGKKPEAANTYREMLRNEKLKDRPELSVARSRLQVLDPSAK
ncbi:MAG: tetratricopeptide repeat protein [Opitutaceae bacterium]|jgi:tetratricopeptide (TPR) repeat protein